ncbi:hypothetical protein LUZ60_002650 [Juncus effusus]|nr:hypothetical protein LUZ60_002650 [Juncus effusus]
MGLSQQPKSQFRPKILLSHRTSTSFPFAFINPSFLNKAAAEMGGQKRGRTQRKHFKQNRDNVWKYSNENKPAAEAEAGSAEGNPTWQPFATQNPGFEEYYKGQGIVREEEWEEFIATLRVPLPAAFRINASGQFCEDIRLQLENDFAKCLEAEANNDNNSEETAIRPLPWYPGNLAWHLNFSRNQLRKNQALERFHEFLKQENEVGNITRQEAVSMVPPLFLNVLPEHHILDMCAAPGSKTFQLLEIIHNSSRLGQLPEGLVVANDVDVKRCNLLIHQTKRMSTANLIVTNHEAQHFPCIHMEREEGQVAKSHWLYDRVLCDVPCSGDGTLRKAPDIWRKWNTGMGNALHCLQVLIAMRGLSLLKVGGRMVYSTCSMNPVENEAVVAEILRRCNGSVELLDVSNELSGLVRRPGINTWKVKDRGLWFTSYKQVPKNRRGAIVQSMFPSGSSFKETETKAETGIPIPEDEETKETETKEETGIPIPEDEKTGIPIPEDEETGIPIPEDPMEVSGFPLEYCMRIVPHDQNSGAFFIAVLQKVAPLPAVQTTAKPPRSRQRKSSKISTDLEAKSDEKTEPMEIIPEPTETILDENTEPTEMMEATEPTDIIIHDEETKTVPDEKTGPAEIILDEKTEPIEIILDEKTELTEITPIIPDEKTEPMTDINKNEGHMSKNGENKTTSKWRGVDPVIFFSDENIISSITSFYGISHNFPIKGHLVTRNDESTSVKRIYYVSNSVREISELNLQVGQRLKITSLGLKIFERQTVKDACSCAYRISSEGLQLLLPYITKQILYSSSPDFEHLLKYRVVKFADFVDVALGEQASALLPGCCVVVLREGNVEVDASTVAIVCWKGKSNLSIMVSPLDAKELLQRLQVRSGANNNQD